MNNAAQLIPISVFSYPANSPRRSEVIRAAARYIGFQRTGSRIQKAFKSAINGAIRRNLLEYEGTWIRKTKE